MSKIRINSIKVKNYRSFGNEVQEFIFPDENYQKPVAIIGYNNSGKTNLINSIKYGLWESIREETFELKDFHNCKIENPPVFQLRFTSEGLGDDKINDGTEYTNTAYVKVENQKVSSVIDGCNASSFNGKEFSKKWVIKQNAPIFYLNFHNIKDEISTQKSSWGNLKSFLGKHIKKLVENDEIMKDRKDEFKAEVKQSTKDVLEGKANPINPPQKSKLQSFIEAIKKNYSANLRNNDCEVDFGLPEYEDIFLQMMFKIGLNGDSTNLIPIYHFGDGFISMFVMSVIQAIAEENVHDKCLFLFEEPESFLHENHQEYFYKAVLCGLSENGHQVIYTTHSDRMVDIFDTKGLIRLEFDEEKLQTVKKYNETGEFSPQVCLTTPEEREEIVSLRNYNSFIKSVEPNLNKILFSKKVVLVEGPNDLMVYKEVIKRLVQNRIEDNPEIQNKERYAETYLNFLNIAIIPHHGKITAILLMHLCQHLGVDYFVINDWDLEVDYVNDLSQFSSIEEVKDDPIYFLSEKDEKAKISTNWQLLNKAREGQIHFNIPKLERVIGYDSENKSSIGIWERLQTMELEDINADLFPESLESFLELDKLNGNENNLDVPLEFDDLPF